MIGPTKLPRGVVAVATALVCLLLPASPASAVVSSFTTTGGTLVMAKTGSTTQLVPLAMGTCPAGTFEMETTATTASITSVDLTRVFGYVVGTTTNPYVVVITRTSGSAGTATGSTPATLTGMALGLQVRLYNFAGSCTAGSLLCTWNVSSTSVSGLFSGDPAAPATADTAILSSTTGVPVLGGACTAPFSTYVGGTMRIAGLTVSV